MTTQSLSTATAVEFAPPQELLTQLAFGATLTQALYVIAKLGIADLLADGPQSVSKLAFDTETHERSLYRLLRSLAGNGVFEEIYPKVFALTPNGEAMRSDAPNTFRNAVIFMGEEWHWRVWSRALYSVKTGNPAWGFVHGEDVFDYFSANPHHLEIFNRAMTDLSVGAAPVVLEAYDFSGFGTLADIAGGHGYLLAQILKANPNLNGILFDMPPVIEGANEIAEIDVAGRVEQIAGDFFESVPPGADAYLMKHIIHDWDDDRALRILRNIRAAMPAHGKVLVIEAIVPAGNESHYSKVLDISMLVLAGGIERTADEYRELFYAAGLRVTRIVSTRSPLSIIEAVKD